jgi:hypothetical protein
MSPPIMYSLFTPDYYEVKNKCLHEYEAYKRRLCKDLK